MKVVFLGLLKRLLFWLLFFALLRAIFLVYFQQLISLSKIPISEVLLTFWNALPLDLSTASYILLVSYLLLMMQSLSKRKIFSILDLFYAGIILLVYTSIATAELGLYSEWNTKMSFKALSYLSHPTEVFNSVSTAIFFTLIAFWLLQALLSVYAYFKLVITKQQRKSAQKISALWSLLIVPLILLFGIRGGLGEIPITTSVSYFSKHQILNLASVNSGYNMMVSTIGSVGLNRSNPFIEFSDEEAKTIVKTMHQVKADSTISLFAIEKPNIVVLLLESWSADLIESLGGEAGITPEFKALEKEGLLFTHFYASGNRSQQAMGSLFGGLPGLPITTITDHPEKYAALPSFIQDINQDGYYSSFWFGGQLNYGNILSYLMYNEFDQIIEGKDLPAAFNRGKLGVHDEDLLNYVAIEMGKQTQPFFTTIFTLSSHSPYDMPMEHVIFWPKMEKDFINSAYYTDQALGKFFNLAKQQPWYNNTVFLLVADHSHRTYRDNPLGSFAHHKIPLLILGPALNNEFKGKTYDKVAGNTDIPATLLAQLELDHSAYVWSKNLMNEYYQPFAFFEYNEDGFGYMRQDGHIVWDKNANHFLEIDTPNNNEDQLVREGSAYLQLLFEDFLSY